VDGETYPAGTWVIPTDQEFMAMARELLDERKYPDLRQYPGGPPLRPYDAAAWTLPLQMGVKVGTASAPLAADARKAMKELGPPPGPATRVNAYNSGPPADAAPFDSVPGIGFDSHPGAAAIVPPEGRLTGSGPHLAVDPAQNNSFRPINRAWREGATVRFVPPSGGLGARYVIEGLSPSRQSEMVRSLALVAERSGGGGSVVAKRRVGLFRAWTGAMDEGWTRWLLEQYGFDVISIRPEDFRDPLDKRVDVLILADDARIPVAGASTGRGQGAARGAGEGGMAKPPATPPQGAAGRGAGPRVVRPEHAYALTEADLARLDDFVRGGGTLVCFNNAWRFAAQRFSLPVKNVVEGLKPEQFFLRGSIVKVTTDPAHPVMAGMPEEAAVFVDGSPVFETLDGFSGRVIAKYPDEGPALLSGYLIGEEHLRGKAAALDVEAGKGRVVLIGFRPQWRGQPFGTFRVVFNSALYRGPGSQPDTRSPAPLRHGSQKH
jgi:hypothetical protein